MGLFGIRVIVFNLVIVALALLLGVDAHGQLLQVAPERVGLASQTLEDIEKICRQGIADGQMPGCIVCVGRHGKIAFLEGYGDRSILPDRVPMTRDTVFDLASLTKPIATATSVMILIDEQKLKRNDRVADFFPAFGVNGKGEITIEQLLTHQSGLIPDNSLQDYLEGPEIAWQRICGLKPIAPVGSVFKYSDVNFIVMGKLVEHLSGMPLDAFAATRIFQPLGMRDTSFNPRAELRSRSAPTEQREGHWIQGEVHDPRAYHLGGVAGHAGLFSTCDDLAVFAEMFLSEGRKPTGQPGTSSVILSQPAVQTMTRGYAVTGGIRGLGWDKRTGFSSNRGRRLSEAAFGHGGFTGTVFWIDPEHDLFLIFLSNRLHPDGQGSVNGLAGAISDVVMESLVKFREGQTEPKGVKTGVDCLAERDYSLLAGQRIGLITNHTGRTRTGGTTARLFHDAAEVDLKVLFSPEHGIEGAVDIPDIGNAVDAETGLPIYSLYGATRKPTVEMLNEVDTLVFDIQDIGTRFYTYISTMGEAMRVASEQGKRFVVLDRPNPIGGDLVTGPMLDAGSESFVGYHAIPVRHGMTTGELALMMRDELKLNLDLHVVRCQGWRRRDTWDATNLMWINPSPNMRCLTQALLYPGIGLLETTNLSVGRGTDAPFEVIGAPWVEARALAANLNGISLPGVRFIPIEFTPNSSTFAGKLCQGVNIHITNRELLDPVAIGMAIMVELRRSYPDDWNTQQLNRLLNNKNVYQAVLDQQNWETVLELSQQGVEDFRLRREKYLLYE